MHRHTCTDLTGTDMVMGSLHVHVHMYSCCVTTLIFVPSHGLEIIFLTVSNVISKVCISVFYHPPSSPSVIFEDLYLQFCNCISL